MKPVTFTHVRLLPTATAHLSGAAILPSTRLYSCGKTLMNFGSMFVPVFQDPLAARAAGGLDVPRDQVAQQLDVFRRRPASRSTAAVLQRFSAKSPFSSST